MTDTSTTDPVDAEAEQLSPDGDQMRDANEASSGTESGFDAGLESDTEIKRYLAWGALGVCSLLAVFALVQFYGSATDAIELWVDPKYQPLIGAAFNLAVLLASLIGVSLLVRELAES